MRAAFVRTTDGGESGIIPTANKTVVDEPVEFTFRKEGVNEVESTEIPNANRSKPERLDHPVVLGIPITVLVGPQSMCNTFNRIDDWASKIVCGVNLPLVAVQIN